MTSNGRHHRFDLVILARIAGSGASSSIGPAKLRDSLRRYAGANLTRAELAEVIDERCDALAEQGFLTTRPLTVTAEGRQWLCEQLGVATPPPWKEVHDRLLPMLALGLEPGSPLARHVFATTGNVQALLLAEALGLPLAKPTLAQVVNALIARALETRRPVRSSKDLRPLLAEAWLARGTWRPTTTGPVPATSAASELELTELAAAVRDAAAKDTVGRFGDRQVYISSLHRHLSSSDTRFASCSLDEFKRRLVEANRARLLTLARADYVPAMNRAEVEASHLTDLNSDFHFVVDDSTGR